MAEPEGIDEGIAVDELSLKAEAAARAAADTALPPSGFVIAKTTKGIRRLHFVGNCGKVPGEHYRDFDVWGPILPPEEAIDVTCGICFKGDKGSVLTRPLSPEETNVLALETSSSSSAAASSSSSDSDSAAVISPKKRPKKAGAGAAPLAL